MNDDDEEKKKENLGDELGRAKHLVSKVLRVLLVIARAFTTTRTEAPREVAWDQGTIHIKVGRGFGDVSRDGEVG
jgi:hypothetical protein